MKTLTQSYNKAYIQQLKLFMNVGVGRRAVDMKKEDICPNCLGPLGLTLTGRIIVGLDNFVRT
jgi:hypothetical protein